MNQFRSSMHNINSENLIHIQKTKKAAEVTSAEYILI